MDLVNDPVMPNCKFYCQSLYCRTCLAESMACSSLCPTCRSACAGTSVHRAVAMQIDAMLVKCPIKLCKCKVEFSYVGEHMTMHSIAQTVIATKDRNKALAEKLMITSGELNYQKAMNSDLAKDNKKLTDDLSCEANKNLELSNAIKKLSGEFNYQTAKNSDLAKENKKLSNDLSCEAINNLDLSNAIQKQSEEIDRQTAKNRNLAKENKKLTDDLSCEAINNLDLSNSIQKLSGEIDYHTSKNNGFVKENRSFSSDEPMAVRRKLSTVLPLESRLEACKVQ